MTAGVWTILLTKYNAPRAGVNLAPGRIGIDDEWLEQRLEIFSKWTLPSVLNQRTQPDQWLLFVDAETSIIARRELSRILPPYCVVVDIRSPLTDNLIRQEVKNHLPDETSVLISTRLDNDDALSLHYCSDIQRMAEAGYRGFINPYRGLQLVRGRVLRQTDTSSPFLAYVEDLGRGNTPITVCSAEHHLACQADVVHQMRTTEPAWLQVVHGGNIANQATGTVTSKRKLIRFAPYLASDAVQAWGPYDFALIVRAGLSQLKVSASRRYESYRSLSTTRGTSSQCAPRAGGK